MTTSQENFPTVIVGCGSRTAGNGISVYELTSKGILVLDADPIFYSFHPSNVSDALDKARMSLNLLGSKFLATNNPWVLDLIPPDHVLMVFRKEKGSPIWCNRLINHPEWPKWSKVMTAAEFWQYVGESWVVDTDTILLEEF